MKTAMYGLRELEAALPDSFDSKTILCQSPLMKATDPECEKLAYFCDTGRALELYYQDAHNLYHFRTPPADVVVTRLYRLLDMDDAKAAFHSVDRLFHSKLPVSLYETRKPSGEEVRKILRKSYESLGDDLDDDRTHLDAVEVEPYRGFVINREKGKIMRRLESGEPTDIMIEVCLDNTNYSLYDIVRVVEALS
jgi:hypothetical protein